MRLTALLTPLVLLVACVPKLENGPGKAAGSYCDRAVECGWYDAAEVASCEGDVVDIYEAMWTSNGCGEGFDREAWGTCMDTMGTLDCDSWELGMDEVTEFCDRAAVCQ